jgi:hypothetical protein
MADAIVPSVVAPANPYEIFKNKFASTMAEKIKLFTLVIYKKGHFSQHFIFS